MKIGVLTSSRADYSIYHPLLRKIKEDPFFDLSIIAFGTHLSPFHGHTIDRILEDHFDVPHRIESILIGDSPETISTSVGTTINKFSSFWAAHEFDYIIALGDRFEMFAAVTSLLPFNRKIAHIHGGETTTGAIDNAYRHAISLMSSLHFVSTQAYKERLTTILGTEENIVVAGALSIESLKNQTFITQAELKDSLDIDFFKPVILFTFHPETAHYEANAKHINEILSALSELKQFQILATMPNADTSGNHIRSELLKFANQNAHLTVVETLGMKRYYAAMKYATMMLGNTSSGFVEASFFPTKVINLGNRQQGRLITSNIFNSKIEKDDILRTIEKAINTDLPANIPAYGSGNTSDIIIHTLKNIKTR